MYPLRIPLAVAVGVLFLAGLTLAQLEDPQHWVDLGRRDIQRAFGRQLNHGVAKNAILMIGDGMGIGSVTAGRIYVGQQQGRSGEEHELSFERFPNVGLSKTYNSDRQVPDSAGTATAMLSGYKANMLTLGVNSEVKGEASCATYRVDRRVQTALDFALLEGKSVGLVTTTRITHATPAAAFSHTPFRNWESDANMNRVTGCEGVKDIAYQLILDNPQIQVILGGGRRCFLNNTTPDPRTGKISSSQRKDGLDLIQEWRKEKASRGMSYASVGTKREFEAVDPANTDYLLGLFTSSHMSYDLLRDASPGGEPSLAEMTEKAIKILQKNPKGYFLLVEGGRIDHAHHENYGKLALGDTAAFDKAVIKTQELTSVSDTLTIVTADHSHVFSMAGYPTRGNPITGVVDDIYEDDMPFDKMPYTTLTYANGPNTTRLNYTGVDTSGNDFQQMAGVGMYYETHAGEDVGIYAVGPMSHMIHTTHEQSYIGHVIQYASCYGIYKDSCNREMRRLLTLGAHIPTDTCSAPLGIRTHNFLLMLVATVIISTVAQAFKDIMFDAKA